MEYFVAGIPYSSELYHHGIKGQKWGIRRYQNPDGSLTPEGIQRYGTIENFQSEMARKKERREQIRSTLKTKYNRFQERSLERGKKLSEAGYKKRSNLGHAIVMNFTNTFASTAISSVLDMSGHTKSAKVVKALGSLNNLGIWVGTAKNMYDYENYRSKQRLNKGVR